MTVSCEHCGGSHDFTPPCNPDGSRPTAEARRGAFDLATARPGDAVTIHGTYRGHSDGAAQVTVTALKVDVASLGQRMFRVYVDPKEIAAHEPRPLQADDDVWGLATKCDGKVLHVIGQLAWVQFEDGRHEIVLPDQVERR